MNFSHILEQTVRLTDYGLDFNDIKYVKCMPLTQWNHSNHIVTDNPQVGDIITVKCINHDFENMYVVINRQLPISNHQWNYATPIIRCTNLKLNHRDKISFLNYMKNHNIPLHSNLSETNLVQRQNKETPWDESF